MKKPREEIRKPKKQKKRQRNKKKIGLFPTS